MYELAKTLHLIAMVVWITGMLSVPLVLRTLPGGAVLNDLRQIYTRAGGAALVAVWVFGLWAAVQGEWLATGWLGFKMLLVLGLSGLHGVLSAQFRKRVSDPAHQVSGLVLALPWIVLGLIVVIIALAVWKPF